MEDILFSLMTISILMNIYYLGSIYLSKKRTLQEEYYQISNELERLEKRKEELKEIIYR